MVHNSLTDHQITSAFGDTLSLIYRKKIDELNNDLSEVYAHLDSLTVPRFTDFDRWFARTTVPAWADQRLKAIDHINKIRRMYKKMKREPVGEGLDIERAKAVPLTEIYPFVMKRGNMTHCCFHKDSHPSAKINKNNTMHCWSCGFHGSSIDLFMKLNNVSFVEAVKCLAKI